MKQKISQLELYGSSVFLFSSSSSDKHFILLLCSLVFVLTSDLLPDLHSCSSGSPSHCDARILCIVSAAQGHFPFVISLNNGKGPISLKHNP